MFSSVNLVKEPEGKWTVSVLTKEFEHLSKEYPSIELAADYMESKLGIKDEAIDDALIHIAAYDGEFARFDSNGNFAGVPECF